MEQTRSAVDEDRSEKIPCRLRKSRCCQRPTHILLASPFLYMPPGLEFMGCKHLQCSIRGIFLGLRQGPAGHAGELTPLGGKYPRDLTLWWATLRYVLPEVSSKTEPQLPMVVTCSYPLYWSPSLPCLTSPVSLLTKPIILKSLSKSVLWKIPA